MGLVALEQKTDRVWTAANVDANTAPFSVDASARLNPNLLVPR